MRIITSLAVLAAASCGAMPAQAAQTITYSYDAKGRLVKVVRSGGANPARTTDYVHDKADNRTSKTTS